MFLLGFLGICSYIDIKERRIPLVCIGIGIAYWIGRTGWNIFHGNSTAESSWIWNFLFAMTLAVIFWVCQKVWIGILGMGDVFLIFIVALIARYKIMAGILIVAFCILMGVSAFLLVKGYSKKTTLPFAPFLLVGYVCYLCIIS